MIPGIGAIKCVLKLVNSLLTGITHYWNFTSNKVDLIASWTPTTDTVSISSGSKIGNGCYFDGSTYFNLGSTSVNMATASFSISFHVYLLSLTNAYLFECWSTTPASRVLEIRISTTGAFIVAVCDGSDTTASFTIQTSGSGNLAVINTWYHLVVTFNQNGNMVLYVNNVAKGTKAVGVRNIATTSLVVGKNYSTSAYLNGYIDELGTWNRELTTGEVAALYNSGAGKQYPF